MIVDAAARLRFIWGCIAVGLIYLFSMLAFHFLTMALGRPSAHYRTLWMLEHLTEWFSHTGRHRSGEPQEQGKKAEG